MDQVTQGLGGRWMFSRHPSASRWTDYRRVSAPLPYANGDVLSVDPALFFNLDVDGISVRLYWRHFYTTLSNHGSKVYEQRVLQFRLRGSVEAGQPRLRSLTELRP